MAETTTTTPATTPKVSLMSRMREFFKEVRLEVEKVSWPTRHELRDQTIVVIVAVILISVFVGLVDRVLSFLMGLIIH